MTDYGPLEKFEAGGLKQKPHDDLLKSKQNMRSATHTGYQV